ncbi:MULTISPECIES: hypothetical protein [Providencia]|uniref:hypothetical protein n=1 Tax=Providencia TaxID=586 RepID=UPI0024813F87|nr:hypothetical protein [Providencia rettgeri]MDU7495878.1 hypothetical protein [Providencia rettgeri]HEM8306995.1 hypothetical protein [Providencia rettgeri]
MSTFTYAFLIVIAIYVINRILSDVRSDIAEDTFKKNKLIKEAQKVREFLDNKEWSDMTNEERECYTIANERLRALLGYKKNQTPDYLNLTSWPHYYCDYLKNKHDKFTG